MGNRSYFRMKLGETRILEYDENNPRAIGKHKNAVRESKLSPPAFFSFSRMLCIRWAANAARPVVADNKDAFFGKQQG
jgi:hypothetical protein